MFENKNLDHIYLKYLAMPRNEINEDYINDIMFLLGIIKGHEIKLEQYDPMSPELLYKDRMMLDGHIAYNFNGPKR
jgi:hypothetical protein